MQAAEHLDKRYESELLLLPSYCSWAMHVVPVLRPRMSCARRHRLLAAAFCKKATQLGAVGELHLWLQTMLILNESRLLTHPSAHACVRHSLLYMPVNDCP